jgi:hypothetical protein
MRRKKKTTIVTFEARERTTLRSSERRFIAWCSRCETEVVTVTPNEAAMLVHTDPLTILRRIEAGSIHFIELEAGALLVCSRSLVPFAQPESEYD